ncbi:Disease resistance protein CC-NBS-LRR class family [Prunus dulcis]|uniref:Disease resistance protein CC-NBS-LRR class family n=1 Tax=Prunus dulcis TaxID=3755 RepID=A0A5H2XRT3_PRUDU|nr:Disease resistance protein CC-NBS-LRR class family [Prunus dulcis]
MNNLLSFSFLFKYHWVSNYFIFLFRLRATQVKARTFPIERDDSILTHTVRSHIDQTERG